MHDEKFVPWHARYISSLETSSEVRIKTLSDLQNLHSCTTSDMINAAHLKKVPKSLNAYFGAGKVCLKEKLGFEKVTFTLI